jgi:hypothetical protein
MDRRRFLKNSIVLAGVASSSHLFKSGPLHTANWARPNASRANVKDSGRGEIDLSNAVIVAPGGLSSRERKAVQVLVEEIERRTAIRLAVTETWPEGAKASIFVSPHGLLRTVSATVTDAFLSAPPPGPEGYTLQATSARSPTVAIVGADERGVLFGVGGLLRNLRMSRNQIRLNERLNLSTHPRYPLRGHQLGYRPKTNSYDGWTVEMWDTYIRDLAIFGTNAIELIPPRSDDEPYSPHFWLPPKQMMVEMSRVADGYGLDVWIWYPAMDKDYSNPTTVDFALNEWGEIFQALPRVDAVFVPGGDPGHMPPQVLFALLEKQHANLRHYHPRATIWVSPQGFNRQWMANFFDILRREQPEWLAGVVFGPQIFLDMAEFRQRLPSRYPIRFYPDITHSVECQFPVAEWDTAYAYTEGREVINPRPQAYADIMRVYLPDAVGFISYSEGCNDDVNKFVASSLAWDPHTNVIDILREYSRYFISDEFADSFAQGLLALEGNWRGSLISNEGVVTTLRQFQAIEDAASPHDLLNWRLQQGVYRAYYDAYQQARLIYETSLELQALECLERVRQLGVRPVPPDVGDSQLFSPNLFDVLTVLGQAEALLEKVYEDPVAQDWRTRILDLGEALYQSIRMQLAVERYQAEAVSRGATLDTLDAPITNVPWLLRRIREIRTLASDNDRIQAILQLLNRTNPGPGGFYDDLGNIAHEPHLVRGQGSLKDPEFRASALDGFDYPDEMGNTIPVAWKNWAESLYDAPLEMQYTELDRAAQYRIRVIYAGDSMEKKIRLVAGKNMEVHGYIQKPWPIKPLEFDIPQQATAGGELRLSWYREPGLGGNGRGCQVAEVWLMIKQTGSAHLQ